jgi:hypothetical protein
MEEIEIFLRLAFAGIGLIMTALTIASWNRTREPKLMLATAGFAVLAAEGILLSLGIFSDGIEAMNTTLTLVGLNFLALVLIYLSVLKR